MKIRLLVFFSFCAALLLLPQMAAADTAIHEAYIDEFSGDTIGGWAYDGGQPPRVVIILENTADHTQVVLTATAELPRQDALTYLSQKYNQAIGSVNSGAGFRIQLSGQAYPNSRYKIASAKYDGLDFNDSSPLRQIVVTPGIPSGTVVNDHGTVFLIIGEQKIPFSNWQAFVDLGYSAGQIQTMDPIALANYIQTPTLDNANSHHPYGSWVNNQGTIYYVSESGLIGVPSYQIFLNNRGNAAGVVKADAADLELLRQNPHLPLLDWNDERVTFRGLIY